MVVTHRRLAAGPSVVFATRRPYPSEPEQDNDETDPMCESLDLEPDYPEIARVGEWAGDVFLIKP